MDPSEVEDDQDILLIWDLEVQAAMSASASALPPKSHLPDKMPTAPLLDLQSTLCNCSSFPNVKLVVVNRDGLQTANGSVDSDCHSSSDNNDDYDDDGEEEENKEEEEGGEVGALPSSHSTEKKKKQETSLFTEFISLKGSSYHGHFQEYLKSCKTRLCMKDTPSIRLHRESTNIRDGNAIVVQVLLDE